MAEYPLCRVVGAPLYRVVGTPLCRVVGAPLCRVVGTLFYSSLIASMGLTAMAR